MGQCFLAGHAPAKTGDFKLLLTISITKSTTFSLPENFSEYDDIFVEAYMKRTDGNTSQCAFAVKFCNSTLTLQMYSGGTAYDYYYAGNHKLFWNENKMLGLQLTSNTLSPSSVTASYAQTTGGVVSQNGTWVISGTIKIYGRKGG